MQMLRMQLQLATSTLTVAVACTQQRYFYMSGGFEDLGLLPELVKATQDLGWLLPSDVQVRCWNGVQHFCCHMCAVAATRRVDYLAIT